MELTLTINLIFNDKIDYAIKINNVLIKWSNNTIAK